MDAPLAAPDADRASDAPVESDTSSLDAGAPVDLAAADGAVDGNASCWRPVFPLPAPVACSATVQACDLGLDDCLSSSQSRPLARIANRCGTDCGEIAVGFVGGCAAEVRVTDRGPIDDTVEACLSQAILGARWACSPDSGWVRVFIGSCTIL